MKDALRIALFTYSTKPRGGVIHTLALAENLQRLGHAVHIFALGKDQQGFFRPTPVSYTLIPFGILPDDIQLDERIKCYIQSYFEFLAANRSEPFDIYHVQDCVSANALWRAREEGLIRSFGRTVHHVDDFVSPTLIQCQSDSIYRPDHRIVVSRTWQVRLKADYGLDSDVIYNGVDLGRYQPPTPAQRAAARATLGLKDEVALLNVGGIEPRKNTIRLARAVQQVQRRLAEAGRRCLLLVAGGETLLDHTLYRQEFFALFEGSTLQLDRDVRLLGVIPDEQLPALYHAADVLAFPSVKEGWGLVVLEALASDLPVLASDLPVFHEYLQSNESALLVDPFDEAAIADGLIRLAQEPDLRLRLSQAGRQTVQKYSWAATARAHVACYRRWLAEEQP